MKLTHPYSLTYTAPLYPDPGLGKKGAHRHFLTLCTKRTQSSMNCRFACRPSLSPHLPTRIRRNTRQNSEQQLRQNSEQQLLDLPNTSGVRVLPSPERFSAEVFADFFRRVPEWGFPPSTLRGPSAYLTARISLERRRKLSGICRTGSRKSPCP